MALISEGLMKIQYPQGTDCPEYPHQHCKECGEATYWQEGPADTGGRYVHVVHPADGHDAEEM